MTPTQMKEFTILMNAATVEGAYPCWVHGVPVYELKKAGYCATTKEGKHIVKRERLIADLAKDPKNLRFRTEGVGSVTYYTIIKYLINTI